jgi:hypothetical protein
MKNFPDSLKKRLSVKIITFLPTISNTMGWEVEKNKNHQNKITCVKK